MLRTSLQRRREVSDDTALLEGLEEVLNESRKLRVRLALLQREVEFYPLLTNPALSPGPPPADPQIAKSTFGWPKAGKEGDGIFNGLRTVPPNPEPIRLPREISVLPVQVQNNDDAIRRDVDQLEPVTALAGGG